MRHSSGTAKSAASALPSWRVVLLFGGFLTISESIVLATTFFVGGVRFVRGQPPHRDSRLPEGRTGRRGWAGARGAERSYTERGGAMTGRTFVWAVVGLLVFLLVVTLLLDPAAGAAASD